MEVENEIWRNISDYPNYQVSNLGRVKSMERKIKCNKGYRIVRERILKPYKDKGGYLMVSLWREGKMKKILVHRLVASAFVQNNSLFNNEINHKDENKSNNCAENLEWCEHIHNINYGTHNERVRKSNTNNPKKSKAVMCIETGDIYPSVNELKRKFGFDNSHISKCCRGKIELAYGYHWCYVE